ncbi:MULTISPECIES: hypothetical protein [Wolbachia]|nr:hypothetical protein [Wolbachia endosymbiont (group A) of Platycheirus albimanus]
MFIAKRQSSSRYVLAGSMLRYSRGSMLRDTANESRYDGVMMVK